MPVFKNDTAHHLSFDVGDEHHEVPPGKACEIPKAYCYVVASRGLPLTRVGAGEAPDVVDSTEARRPAMRMIPGVENVDARADDEDEDDNTDGAEGAAEVEQAVASLKRQGVAVPGRKARG